MDRRDIHAVLGDVQYLSEDASFASATKRFGEARIHQERSLRAEEELIRMLELLPDPPVVVAKLRAGQRQIRALLEDTALALTRRDVDDVRQALGALQQALAAHQEEQSRLLDSETCRLLVGLLDRD